MSTSELSYTDILRTVYNWPASKRFHLVQDLLKTLEPVEQPAEQQDTLSLARGLLATNQPAPSDEEIAKWLDQHRSQKYR